MADSNNPLDLNNLKRHSCDRLIQILEDASGKKDIVIDGDLMKMLDRIADAKILRDHGVDKIYRLDRLPPPVLNLQRIYIVHPSLLHIKYIADHTHANIVEHPDLRIHLIAVPRIVSYVNELLEEEGLFDIINIHEFSPNFIALDDDLISLELHHFFRESFLDGDLSSCVSIGHALHVLEGLYGRIPQVLCHGRAAQATYRSMKIFAENDPPKSTANLKESKIGYLFLFDRDADFVTPLLSQLTYEGILDEYYGIRAGVMVLPAEVAESGNPSKIQLNSQDAIFDKIRNRHFAGVSGYLVNRAKDIESKKQQTSNMTTAQMKEFVASELKSIQALQKSITLHLSICESIAKNTRKDFDVQLGIEHGMITGANSALSMLNYLKDCFACQLPIHLNLRLLCLLSLTQDGLPKKDYKDLCAQFLAAHGHKHLVTLYNLRQMGMLSLSNTIKPTNPQENKIGLKQVASSILLRNESAWKGISRRLKAVPDGDELIDLHNPTHMSYVFNGAYTPIIPKLVSEALIRGADSITETLKLIPGSTTCVGSADLESASKVALVVFLGGVTFSEIAALRLLAISLDYRIIVATTNTVTGENLIKSALIA